MSAVGLPPAIAALMETPLDDFGDVPPFNDDQPLFERGDHVEMAQELVRRVAPPDEFIFDEGKPWRYGRSTGVFPEVDHAELSRLVQSFAGAPAGAKGDPLDVSSSDVKGTIALAKDRVSQPNFFASAAPGLAFTNGFLRFDDNGARLVPHSPANRARARYPFPYERNRCPTSWLACLDGLFRDDADKHEKVDFFQEFFGACMAGIATRFQQCVVAVGGGDNGKSVVGRVMMAAMPAGTTSAIPPQDLGHEYKRAMLVGKRLNVVPEMPDREILASEAFKAIVAGDAIVARPIREAPFMFSPIAGHYFAANVLPGTTDQSDGFWRRWGVMTFNRSFRNDPTRDPNLADNIIANELPAIVSWLVEGACRVMQSGKYTVPSSHHEAIAAWRKNADQVALFVESECTPLEPTARISGGTKGSTLYALYTTWCTNNGHRALASNRFAERMQNLGLGAKHTRNGRMYPVVSVKGCEGWVKGDPSHYSREVPDA